MSRNIKVQINDVSLIVSPRDDSRATVASIPLIVSWAWLRSEFKSYIKNLQYYLSKIIAANATFVPVRYLCLVTTTEQLIIIPVWYNQRLIDIWIILCDKK